MIQINSRELDEIIKNFDKKLAEYEQNIHVLDYEMKAIKDNWQSNRANLLYTVVDENQNKSKRLILFSKNFVYKKIRI